MKWKENEKEDRVPRKGARFFVMLSMSREGGGNMQSASCSFAQGEHSHSIAARRPVARPHDLCEMAQGCNKTIEAQLVGSDVSKNNETEPSLAVGWEVFETVALKG